MAINSKALNSSRTVTTEVTDIDFSGGTAGEATVTVPELRHVEGPERVHVQAYGSGDADANQGFVARCTSVGENGSGVTQLTIRLYQGDAGPTTASPLQDAGVADVDHLYVRATGQ
jgi:hypothetical protein